MLGTPEVPLIPVIGAFSMAHCGELLKLRWRTTPDRSRTCSFYWLNLASNVRISEALQVDVLSDARQATTTNTFML